MDAPLITLRDASFGYDDRRILEHLTFAVGAGDFVALLGPNGAGKTTLLRGVVGLIPLLTGSLEYGFDRAANPIGYVPQRESLDPTFPLSVFEVVLMGTYARLTPLQRVGRRQRELTARALDLVGLGAIAAQRFASLSGGQTQRALIARALAAEPRLLLLDEPTAGVDAEATATIMAVLSRLNRDEGLTVLLVTHQLRMLQGLVSGAFWVQDGRVARRRIDDLAKSGAVVETSGGE